MFHYKCGRFAIIGVMTVLTVLVTATCNLQPVSTIRVKASPEVYLPLGAKQFDTRELFKKFEEEMTQSASFNSFGKTTANNTNGVTYRYTSPDAENPDQLRYLVHYPVQSFSFNIENYFGKKQIPAVRPHCREHSIPILQSLLSRKRKTTKYRLMSSIIN